jgi:hypothetical protein
MAIYAGIWLKVPMSKPSGTDVNISKATSMGFERQISGREPIVAVRAEFNLSVTAGTKLGICPGGYGMGHLKVGPMDISPAVAKLSLIRGKSGFMTIQTPTLRVAG